jgi:CRISPR/Cas system-associated protein Csx1
MTPFWYAAQNTKASELMNILVDKGAQAIEGNFKPVIVYVHHEKLSIAAEVKDEVVKTLLNYAFKHQDNDSIVAFATDPRVSEEDKYKENLYHKAKECKNVKVTSEPIEEIDVLETLDNNNDTNENLEVELLAVNITEDN